MNAPRRTSWIALALGLVCGPAYSDDDVVRLPAWRVEESREAASDTSPGGASSVVVAADRGEGAWKGLDAAVGGVPGLMVLKSFGGFEPARLSIRGSGIQSAPSSRGLIVAIDGLPLNLADGSFNSALADAGLADEIDVYRGYEAASLGAGAMGGVLDLRGADGEAPGSIAMQSGSFGYVRAQAEWAARSSVPNRGGVSWQSQDGFREHSRQARQVFEGGLTLRGVRVSVYGARLSYDVPGPLTLAAAHADPTSVSADVQRDQPRRESSYLRAAVGSRWEGDGRSAGFSVGLAHHDDLFRQLQANGISKSDGEDLMWNGSAKARAEGSGIVDEVRVGTTGEAGTRDLRRYANDLGRTGAAFGDDGLRASTATVNVENRLIWRGGMALATGGTWMTARRDIADRRAEPSGAQSTTRAWSDSRGLGRARLTWTPTARAAFYVDWSQSAEPPTFDDLLVVTGVAPALARRSQALNTQEASSWELGSRGSAGRIEWDLSLYRGTWDNEILRIADAKGLPRGAVNAGPTVHEGAETTFRWRLLEGRRRLALETTAMWTRCRFAGDPVYGYNRLAGLPPHQGRARLVYDDGGRFGALTCDWTAGRTLADHAGRLGYGGQATWSAKLGWRVSRQWSLFAQVDNLLDRRWIASPAGVLDVARAPLATSLFLPGMGRSVTAGVTWRR